MDGEKNSMVGVNGRSFVLTVRELKKTPYRTEGTRSVNSPLKRRDRRYERGDPKGWGSSVYPDQDNRGNSTLLLTCPCPCAPLSTDAN